MSTEFQPLYDVVGGDVTMIIKQVEKNGLAVSVELISDVDFDGTTATARLLQANDIDLDIENWNQLPEPPLILVTGAGSSLLQTVSFTCKFLAVEILVGDATIGKLKVIEQFNG